MSWISKLLQKIYKRKQREPLKPRPAQRWDDHSAQIQLYLQLMRDGVTPGEKMFLQEQILAHCQYLNEQQAHLVGQVEGDTVGMQLRERADNVMDRMTQAEYEADKLIDHVNKLDGTVPGTNSVHDRIAKTDDEYNNRIFPSTGKTEAQMDAWNALMLNGGRVMLMGRDKPAYVEVNPKGFVSEDKPPTLEAQLAKANRLAKENAERRAAWEKENKERFLTNPMEGTVPMDQATKDMAARIEAGIMNPALFAASVQDQLPSLEEKPLALSSLDQAGEDDLSSGGGASVDPAGELDRGE